MNTQQLNRLKRTTRRSLLNRFFILLLFITLTVVTIHDNIKINNLQKDLKNSRITIIESDKQEQELKKAIELKAPKIEDVKGL